MFTISRVPSPILRDMTEIKVYYSGGNVDYSRFGEKPDLSTDNLKITCGAGIFSRVGGIERKEKKEREKK